MDEDRQLYFIEMNTRIQVEHPVDRSHHHGIDLVAPSSASLPASASVPYCLQRSRSRATPIECRINARAPRQKFTPSAGKITAFNVPGGNGVRVEIPRSTPEGIVPPYYDSLIAKLIVHGVDRAEAIAKMERALKQFVVQGIDTSIPLHQEIFADEDFRAGNFDTKFMERFLARRQS